MKKEKEDSFLGAGMHVPFEVDEVNGRIVMSRGEDSIRESIQVILMTGKGERLMRPDFGCNLKNFVFDTMDYGNLVRMEEEVRNALIQWEPRITDIEAKAVPGPDNMIQIHISYRVRVTNNPYNMVFPFYLEEGFVR